MLTICFIGLLAITACEFNDKVERVSTSGLDTINFDSVVVVDVDGYETDHYDSTLQNGLVLMLIDLMVLIFLLLNN